MTAAITIDQLDVRLGHTAILSNISADLPVGQVIGLLGPSGSGKTTLIRTLLGLQRPTSGTVTILDRPAGHQDLHHMVGYVTQSPSVYADLTVTENLNYFAKLLGADRRQVTAILRQVELLDQATQIIATLSGGQRARVSLAVALLGDPQILLLDEPTVGLDPVLRVKLWDMFHALARSGVTILVSSHVMDEADRCDRIIFLRDGAILASGTPRAIQKQTKATDMEGAFLALAGGTS